VHTVVTGGAGFIGSHLVDALLAVPDNTVCVLDSLHRGRRENLSRHHDDPRLKLVVGDLRDPRCLLDALVGAQVVFHLAAQSNVMGALSDPRFSFETNVGGTFNVLEAARDNGVPRVVFASSREVYGEATDVPVSEGAPLLARNPYGASKVAAEAYCRAYGNVFGLDVAILRFANVYGPRDVDRVIPMWLNRALRGEPLEIHGGDQIVDFVWVGLAVEALIRAAAVDVAGVPINVGSGAGTELSVLAARILEATGSSSQVRTTAARTAEVRRFVADVRRMNELLGLVPTTDPLADLSRLLPRELVA
jgi:UDP-glucose 4-epimerase